MTKVGGLTTKFYTETKGLKVSGGKFVKAGTVITREGHKWKPGKNINGTIHLTAGCDGVVRFTKKMGKRKKAVTYVHIEPVEKAKKVKPKKKTATKKEA